MLGSAIAASDTWNGIAADNQFATPGNWVGGQVPGVADGTYLSTDVATINGGPPADLSVAAPAIVIATDANRNLFGITFDVVNTQPFTIGSATGEALHLTGGGVIQTTANFVNNSTATTIPVINAAIAAPMAIHGNTYTFAANQAATASALLPSGTISFASAGASTITLDGTHAAGQTVSNTQLKSYISDAVGGTTGITKNGTGTWEIFPSVTNTYSGDTVINSGMLRIRGVLDPATGATIASGVSSNSNYIIATGARLRFSDNVTATNDGLIYSTNHVMRSVTVNSGGTLEVSNGNVTFKMANNSGPGLILNFTTAAQSLTARFSLSGTAADQGGVKLSNGGTAITTVDLGGTGTQLDLGSVRRPFDIAAGAAANAYDLRIRGPISGSGGILKLGPGTLRIDSGANTMTGNIEVREGRLLINNSNAFATPPQLIISGGTFAVAGTASHNFSAVTVSSGTITTSSAGRLLSPAYSLNVAGTDVANVGVILSDSASGPATVTKTGTGTATLTGANTYTGNTTVNGGTLRLAGNARNPLLTAVGYTDVIGGKLTFDWAGGTSPKATIVPILTANAPTLFASGQIRRSNASNALGLGWVDDTANSLFTVAAVYNGDANIDGSVSSLDFDALVAQFGKTSDAIWAEGDFNYDGKINTDDFNYLAGNFGLTAAPIASLGAVVPEPTCVALLVAGGSLMTRRRAKKAIEK
jgi:autotransporter-associated beta strand protein